ncbi:hypothetical protein Hanom_Chr09g00855431 [Helianthus anomalus]
MLVLKINIPDMKTHKNVLNKKVKVRTYNSHVIPRLTYNLNYYNNKYQDPRFYILKILQCHNYRGYGVYKSAALP